jgi:hypothetical protein
MQVTTADPTIIMTLTSEEAVSILNTLGRVISGPTIGLGIYDQLYDALVTAGVIEENYGWASPKPEIRFA